MRFQEIYERCWTGYRQAGMKKKDDRMVPNCVPVEEVKTGPEMTLNDLLYTAAAKAMHQAGLEGVPMDYEEAIKKAAKIYRIPYTPSELPKLLAQRAEIDRKLAMLKQGKQIAKARRQEKLAPTPAGAEEYWKTHALPTDRIKPAAKSLEETEAELAEDLKKWFKEKWVRFGPDGKIRGACARGSKSEGKPKCLPQAKAHALGKKGRASAAAKKRREDPNPERRGPARNVATKVKEQYTGDDDWYDEEDEDLRLRSGDYVRDRQDGEYGEIFRMSGDPSDRRVRILDRDGKGWYISPDRLEPVDPTDPDIQKYFGKRRQRNMDEATGDPRFDQMMGRIVDPVAALKQDRVYEEQLEDYVFEFMNEFLTRMDQLGIEVWRDNPRAGEDLTNPKFAQAYEQASLKAVQKFMQRKKLDTNNQRLVAQVKADFDENADQVNPVAGFLGAFMQGFTTLRPGEIDIISKAGMFKKPGQDIDEQLDASGGRMYQAKEKFLLRHNGKDVAFFNTPEDAKQAAQDLMRDLKGFASVHRVMREQDLDEKQDACYRKVKSRYKVWPSAYASGALVQCRKKGAANWGNKKKKE